METRGVARLVQCNGGTHRDWNNETFVSPRLSVGYIPEWNDRWTLRAATGLYYQAPFYKELRDTVHTNGSVIVQLNPAVRSQRSVHFVVGADYTFQLMKRPFKFTAEAYYKRLSNLIPYTVDNVRVVYYGRNLASGYATGIDFKLFGEFVPGHRFVVDFLADASERKNGWRVVSAPHRSTLQCVALFHRLLPRFDALGAHLARGVCPWIAFRAAAFDKRRTNVSCSGLQASGCGFKAELKNGRRPVVGWGKYVRDAWLGIDCFNLLGIRNVNSYYWITDIEGNRHGVPNYLTGRQLNLRFNVEF